MSDNYREAKFKYCYPLCDLVTKVVYLDKTTLISECGFNFNEEDKDIFLNDFLNDFFKELDIEHTFEKIQKETILHDFIMHCFRIREYHLLDNLIESYFEYDFPYLTGELFDYIEEKENILEEYKMDLPNSYNELFDIIADFPDKIPDDEFIVTFKAALENYGYDLIETMAIVLEKEILDEVFNVLFQNKNFLFDFNLLISTKIKSLKKIDYPTILEKDGVIKRDTYIPKWLHDAIYFRDRGHCQFCHKDLTNLVHINADKELQFDHIIPLEQGGTNDATNFQLSCAKCNRKKHIKIEKPHYIYQFYWTKE